jgi:hypothetical protein
MLPLDVAIFLCDRRRGFAGWRRCSLNLDRRVNAEAYCSARNISAVRSLKKFYEICGAVLR